MRKILSVFLFVKMFSMHAYAIEDTQVLPKGVRSLIFQNGNLQSLGEKYDSASNLQDISKRYSQSFTAEKLQKFAPEAKQLVDLLDKKFNQNYSLVSSLYLGELNIEAEPEIQYYAPIFAIGITDQWTFGFGMPFVHLTADMNITSTGNNNAKEIEEFLYQKSGFSSELESAFARLKNMNLVQEFKSVLKNKSYKEVQDQDRWYRGDLVLVNKYRYQQSEYWDLAHKLSLSLPTGYKDDADDLTDLSIFGQTSIEYAHIQDYKLSSKSILGSSLGYVWTIEDKVEKRVPSSADDILPDESRKEKLSRDLGDSFKWEINLRHNLHRDWSAAVAYLGQYKDTDYYSGNRNYNYSYLSKNTLQKWHRFEAEIRFSTINGFLAKQYVAPLSLSYKYGDVFDGTNVERQQMHSLSFTLLF